MWYAHVTQSKDWPIPARPGILHLSPFLMRPESTDVTSAVAFAEFIAAHSGISKVILYDSRFPQRPVDYKRFIVKWAPEIWKEA